MPRRRSGIASGDCYVQVWPPAHHESSHTSGQSPAPRATYIFPLELRVIFCTCFAISARTSRASHARIDCKSLSRASANRLVSRSRNLSVRGSEPMSFLLQLE